MSSLERILVVKRILAKSQLRQLSLIELLDSQNQTINFISRELGYNRKTLAKDIFEINECIAPIKIEQRDKLYLTYPKNYSVRHIYHCFLKKSVEFELIERIFLDETKTLDEWAEELFLAVSTLRRMIVRINKELKREGIMIAGPNLYLKGKEHRICNFMVYLFLEKYPEVNVLFTLKQRQIIYILVNYYSKYDPRLLNHKRFKISVAIVMVSIIRVKNGYPLIKSKKLDYLTKRILRSKKVQLIFKKYFNSELTSDALYRINYILVSGIYAVSYEQVIEIIATDDELRKKFVSIEQAITEIQTNIGVPIRNKEDMILMMFNISRMQYGKSYILYNENLVLDKFFWKQYPKLIKIMSSSLEKICMSDDKEHELNEYIHALIIYWLYPFKSSMKRNSTLKIGLFYDYDLEYMKVIEQEIYLHFPSLFTVVLLHGSDISSIKNRSYDCDIYLTNISGLIVPGVDVLCFPILPQAEDWLKLYSSYQKIQNEKRATRLE